MRKLIILLWSLLFCAPAFAGTMLLMGSGTGTPAPVVPPWTKTYEAIINNGYGNPKTFTAVPVNNVSTADTLVVFVTNDNASISSVSIGGYAMTQGVQASVSTRGVGAWYLTGYTLTTANVIVTGSQGFSNLGITVGFLHGFTSTPTSTATCLTFPVDPRSTSTAITVPTGGIGFAVYGVTGAGPAVWSNMPNVDSSLANTWTHSVVHTTTVGSVSPTASGGFSYQAGYIVAITWGP
jgi:hypothetical protein